MKQRLFKPLGVFLGLLILLEGVLWLFGFRPGVLEDKLFPPNSLEHLGRLLGDSNGITIFSEAAEDHFFGSIINKQGFRSTFDFNPATIDSLQNATQQKVVFLIGDSYTEGCCVTHTDKSFSNLLAKDSSFILLNFGVGGIGLQQYQLIVENYIPLLQPDLVVVAIYLGNDPTSITRPITPNIPIAFTFHNYPWLNSVGPKHHIVNYDKPYFQSPEEAYDFYINHLTLWGTETTWKEKILRNSIILSKIYLGTRENELKKDYFSKNPGPDELTVTRSFLHEINKVSRLHNAPLIYLGIPAPADALNQENLEEKYGSFFIEKGCFFPDIEAFEPEDYDGLENYNHFNDEGHYKFSLFASEVIEHELKSLP